MTTPGQFAGIGLDIITEWQQITERLMQFAAVYEARQGTIFFNNAKHAVIPPAIELTPQQVADNAELDRLAAQALEIVTHHNELITWYDAGRRVRVALLRSDY